MADASQTLTWNTQTAAVTVTGSADAPTCVIENNSGQLIYARNDGVVAVVAAAGTIAIESGATIELDNTLPLQNPNVLSNAAKYYNGVTGAFDQSWSTNWTAQSNLVTDSLSLIPVASATGTVTITFQ
jgi:hypothetical protein